MLDCEMPFSKLRVRGDSMCYLVPWAALPAVHHDGYWIEQVAIELASDVGGTNIMAKAPKHTNSSLLVAGGIDYGPLTSTWPLLPGSLQEAKQVEALFHREFPKARVRRLSGSKATEAALARGMVGQDFIHLATHGFFRRENIADAFAISGATTLLSTGLIVAPATATPETTQASKTASEEDQYMTAAEIRQLDLSRASLVMLSACESGLGHAQAGQGMAGMFSSFHAAGAEHVIGTLWPVDDAATVAFVERFYDHLWQRGKTVTEAIRGAQIDMLSSADSGLRSHPYAWAAFVCSSR
ncbi:tetratricopeptide repeat domain protein [Rhodopirellula maiorica SM1]|uniref:Tetratricopeptide repeat domain protein n=1 Tax=Rhodopirellula maiorica SM1 TaxID=1265738 RepID=M5S2E2_9BACT|nr:tetratricopeptide repeat domain protein [Rhodopirellula maiorica SM1]